MYLLTSILIVILPFLSQAIPSFSRVNPTEIDLTKVGFAKFPQPKNHFDPSSGTFKQHYAYSYQYWKGPGSPVVFGTPGEVPLAIPKQGWDTAAHTIHSLFSPKKTTVQLAKELGAIMVQLEHRYFGASMPYSTLDDMTLLDLTVDNAIADMVNFAQHVQFPFDLSGSSQASKAPWIFIGGSYAGSLPAWTAATSPGTFWAYWASSAPVQAMDDFWEYQVPIQKGMPKNCSADATLIAERVDEVFTRGTPEDLVDLKSRLGLPEVEDDVIIDVVSKHFRGWQRVDFTSDRGKFFPFCDYIENVFQATDPIPGSSSVGLEKALYGYAAGLQKFHEPIKNAPLNTVWELQWNWLLCNEPLNWWPTGAPADKDTIIPRIYSVDQKRKKVCEGIFNLHDGYTVQDFNNKTGGWSYKSYSRLLFINGEFDPWRSASVSSEFRPGGPLKSTKETPVSIVPGGMHGSDLNYENALANSGVMMVVDKNIKQIVKWVQEWPGESGNAGSSSQSI